MSKENKEEIYKGVTMSSYQKALEILANRMFDLFDKTENTYNNNRGSNLMWAISFTASLITVDSIDHSLKNKISLTNAIIDKLRENRKDSWIYNDLNLLKD